jgi:hypothetical protein
VRGACRDLVLELLPDAGYPQPTSSLSAYEPVRRTLATRQAAFSANLVSLAVLLSDGPVDVVELVGEPVVVRWRQQALLWMGQLDHEDARRMWQAFRVAWQLDDEPARLRIRVEDGAPVGVIASLPWPFEDRPQASDPIERAARDAVMPAESDTGRSLRKSAFVQTAIDTRELIYALIPFWRRVGDITHVPHGASEESDARLVMETALMVLLPDDEREHYVSGIMKAISLVLGSDDLDATVVEWLRRAFSPTAESAPHSAHFVESKTTGGAVRVEWTGRLRVNVTP